MMDIVQTFSLVSRGTGQAVKPRLSQQQMKDLRMCFALMDEDGSGSIDASEMGGAFKLLNIKMHPREIEALLAEVDPTGAGELDFLEV